MKILIVDDSKAMRMIVKRQLGQIDELEGFESDQCANGAEALAWIKENGAPDVVLCDWNMPEMNGIDLLKALRADGIDVTFVFVTSESQPAMEEEARAQGAQSFITKPFTADTFRSVLAEVIPG